MSKRTILILNFEQVSTPVRRDKMADMIIDLITLAPDSEEDGVALTNLALRDPDIIVRWRGVMLGRKLVERYPHRLEDVEEAFKAAATDSKGAIAQMAQNILKTACPMI